MAGLSERMVALGTARSEIREIFEFGKARIAEVGAENVDDFSLGNPSVPAPDSVRQAIIRLAEGDAVALHGYTSAQGDAGVRKTLADDLNSRFGTAYTGDDLYLTVGAAASLCCCLSAICCPGDEILTIAPYFPEYKVFVETAGATLVTVLADIEDFQIDFPAFEAAITEKTKGIIINTPNNPTGVVYSKQTVAKLAEVLKKKEQEYGHPIYLISDEPYREISYAQEALPWVPSYYDNTVVCYSYSKSLSLPGQRIGYILVPSTVTENKLMYAAICGAGRALGYVCAPSLFQYVAAQCAGQTSDISIYRENRDLLLNTLRELGFTCAQPDGAFYLFPRTPEPDAYAFCEKAKKYDLLLVPGDGFGCPGHVRIAYCVSNEQIRRSLWKFQKLAEDYGLIASK